MKLSVPLYAVFASGDNLYAINVNSSQTLSEGLREAFYIQQRYANAL